MELQINGQTRQVRQAQSLTALLAELEVDTASGVAVLRNGEVVRRKDWPTVTPTEGDEIEIVRPTVGG